MADKGSRPRFVEDDVVEGLVPDPGHPPELKVLRGLLGRGTHDGYWRLYISADLGTYVEFAEDDVVYVAKLGPDGSSVGGTVVWLPRSAPVQRPAPAQQDVQAAYLAGKIAGAYLGVVRPVWPGGGLGLAKTFSVTECATCPTGDGSHTCVPAVCTLATSCMTTVPTDPGCGGGVIGGGITLVC